MTELRAYIREAVAGMFLNWALAIDANLVFNVVSKSMWPKPKFWARAKVGGKNVEPINFSMNGGEGGLASDGLKKTTYQASDIFESEMGFHPKDQRPRAKPSPEGEAP
jgi:hypothetical protein